MTKLGKLIFTIIIIIVIGLIYLFITYRNNNSGIVVELPKEEPKEEVREICYIYNTEALDKAVLKMSFTGQGGTIVKGNFDFIPAEKDSKKGPIEGTAGSLDQQLMARKATLWWQASGEGVTNTEELHVLFGDGIASVGFGEMIDRGDGTYIYKDPTKIDFSLNLQQTDCSDEAI